MKGSIRQRVVGGSHTAYWFTTDPGTGKRVQHTRGGFATKGKAQAHLNATLGKVESGEWKSESAMTVSTLLTEHYLPARRSEGLRASTLDQYANVVDAWIVPHLGATQVRKLTPAAVLAWQTTLAGSGSRTGKALSPRSVQLSVTVLKAATAWSFRNGYVQRDPLGGVRRPKGGASRASRVWTVEDGIAFLGATAQDRLAAAWLLFLTYGPRRGDVAGLKWSAVDLAAGTLRIVETLVIVDGHCQVSEPKTDSGRRTLGLDETVVGVLKAHRRRQLEDRLRAGEAWQESGYVFTDALGAPLRPDWLSDQFVELATAAGLPALTLHGTRHTSASVMLASGVDVAVVAGVLGHSSPAITMGVYRHLFEGETARAGALMTRLWQGQQA